MVGVATTVCLTMNIRIRKPCCRHRATPLMFPCRAYTESPAYLSGGFSVLTRDQLFPPICSHTWRSSPSGSTDALHVAVDSFFVDSWNKLSPPNLLPRLISPMVTTGLAFANLGQGGANLLPPLTYWPLLGAFLIPPALPVASDLCSPAFVDVHSLPVFTECSEMLIFRF